MAWLACGLQILITIISTFSDWDDVVAAIGNAYTAVWSLYLAHPTIASKYTECRVAEFFGVGGSSYTSFLAATRPCFAMVGAFTAAVVDEGGAADLATGFRCSWH
jgi:hypothetical protein